MEALKREQPDEEELRKIFEELEFRTLLDRILKTEKKTAAPSAPVQSDLFGFLRARIQTSQKIQISRG